MKLNLTLGVLTFIFAQYGYAELKQVPKTQVLDYQQAIKSELKSFEEKFSCSDEKGGLIPSNEGLSIPTLIPYAHDIFIDDGSQPAIILRLDFDLGYLSHAKIKATSYQISISTSADFKSIESVTLESQRKIRVNSGTLLDPQMADALETIKSITCVKK